MNGRETISIRASVTARKIIATWSGNESDKPTEETVSVKFWNAVEDHEFWLVCDDDLKVGDEVDIVALVERGNSNWIVSGHVLECYHVGGDAAMEWRQWARDNASHWAGLDPVKVLRS